MTWLARLKSIGISSRKKAGYGGRGQTFNRSRSHAWTCTNVIFMEHLDVRNLPNLIEISKGVPQGTTCVLTQIRQQSEICCLCFQCFHPTESVPCAVQTRPTQQTNDQHWLQKSRRKAQSKLCRGDCELINNTGGDGSGWLGNDTTARPKVKIVPRRLRVDKQHRR